VAAELRIEPAANVIVGPEHWTHPDLGIRIAAPPPVTDARDLEARDRIQIALDHGLASARVTSRTKCDVMRWWLYWSSPVSPSRAVPLAGSPARAMLQVAVQMTRAWLPFLIFCLGVAAIAGLLSAWPLLAFVALSVLVYASLIVHECGHTVAYILCTTSTFKGVFVVGRSGARLVRRRLPPARDTMVTCAGPFAPSIISIPIIWGGIYVLPLNLWVMIAVSLTSISLGHIITLVIPSKGGDGTALRKALRELAVPRGDI